VVDRERRRADGARGARKVCPHSFTVSFRFFQGASCAEEGAPANLKRLHFLFGITSVDIISTFFSFLSFPSSAHPFLPTSSGIPQFPSWHWR
jgi:hypothetical protein